MIKFLFIALTVLLVVGGYALAREGSGPHILETGTFSDGTTIETQAVLITNGGKLQVVQVKQPDGTVCYGIGGSNFNSPMISCVK
ncbi:MAG: hypothetical protein J7501_08585 [Bdellovibrio sp.]|nr:hypothetical protein [Bdellovibrio sp.]